jgi:hypothetical protein
VKRVNLDSRIEKLEVATAPERKRLQTEERKRALNTIALAKLMIFGQSAAETRDILLDISREKHRNEIPLEHFDIEEAESIFAEFLSSDTEAARLYEQITESYRTIPADDIGNLAADSMKAHHFRVEPQAHALLARLGPYLRELRPADYAIYKENLRKAEEMTGTKQAFRL